MTHDTRVNHTQAPDLSGKALVSYGLFGLPLAMVAMPVYVQAPALYAGSFGLSLTLVGTILLVARLLDAFSDPLLGYWMDRSSATRGYAGFVLMSLPLLVTGYLALFHPPATIANDIATLSAWFAGSLGLVYLGFSLATIAHNSWGASLTQLRGERARLTAFREGFGLVGVMIDAAVPALAGMNALSITFVIALSITAWVLIRHAPRMHASSTVNENWRALIVPLQSTKFRWLLGVFAISGIAAAIPATLFLFFATDRLLLAQYAGLFLVIYFAAAALALPLWAMLSKRIGEARAWLFSMLLSVIVFVWAWQLAAGALYSFAVICIFSGAALGADLALPPALLAGVISSAGHSGQREGAYFGLWNWMTKMNLALAAGIALPLLDYLGYTPGRATEPGLTALGITYALLPCALKLTAAALLWRAPLREV